MFQMKRLSTARLRATRSRGIFAQRPAQVIATAALLGLLTGCQNISGNTSAAQLRIITASSDAPGLDIYAGIRRPGVQPRLRHHHLLRPHQRRHLHHQRGYGRDHPGAHSTKATLADSSQYTDLIGNSAANMQQTILKDQSQAAPSGQIALRFVDQATRIGALDIYLIPAGRSSSTSPLW